MDTAGHLYLSFGGGGQVTWHRVIGQVAVDPAGQIVCVDGEDRGYAAPVVARFLPDGSPDPAFGQGVAVPVTVG